MSAYGVPQEDISRVIGIAPHTLRAHFAEEISVAAVEATAKVAQRLFKIATEGTGKEAVAACIFWMKCRAGWQEVDRLRVEHGGKIKHDHAGTIDHAVAIATDQEIAEELARRRDAAARVQGMVDAMPDIPDPVVDRSAEV